MWLQWTASPPSIADLDRDGRNEVIGLPNVEQKEPYETQAYAFMVLDGAHGGGASARRHAGFRRRCRWRQAGGAARRRLVPAERHPGADGRRHLRQPPARDRRLGARRLRLRGRARRQAAVALRLRARAAKTFASEVVAADLNRDGRPELVFGTYGAAPGARPPRRALRRGQAARHPPARPGDERQRHRRPGGARRSATSTATAGSRSWSRRSTTGSTSSASRARHELPALADGTGNTLRNGAGLNIAHAS